MKRILAFAPHEDQSDRAVKLAAEICRRDGASLVLLRVLEEQGDWPVFRSDRVGGSTVHDLLAEREFEELRQIGDRIAPDLDDIEIEVVWGVPWEVIIARVEAGGFDLVVKPAWGGSPDRRVFFGATALHLFNRCPCPVWVVGGHERLPVRILAAIDPTPGESRREVAARILEWSKRVADLNPNARLEAGTTWHAPIADLMRRQLPEAEVDAHREDIRRRAQEALRDVLEPARSFLPPERVHFIEGPARQRLPQLIDEENFDLVVMGTLGRDGVAGKLMGETAEWILRAVRTSVLTVPPANRGVRPAEAT